ncbi:MAG: ABC transporter ATP-binding protein [Thiocapsa sp.]|uniref:ABC transporter ATP-binding protein n=1 Tax=Thiocapsa sp. TaxID=2024551 RepID=UPI001BCDC62C|nr:ABC transporter ATP-binding protein [Thiocapsa sp.]QVL50284.1 MAG: ABC transporter ATP-binding protein [Thiocapsa sp.]
MFKIIRLLRDLKNVLSPAQRWQLVKFQFLAILMAFSEIIGIISIAPFIAIVADPSRIDQQGILATLYQWSGAQSSNQFLIYLGVSVLIVLSLSTLVSIFGNYVTARYSHRFHADLSNRLFSYYLNRPWLYHAVTPSNVLFNRAVSEASRVSQNVIAPLLRANASAVFSLTMIAGLIVTDPAVAAFGFVIFGLTYLIIFRTVRGRLKGGGKRLGEVNKTLWKIMAEGFGGIKDVILLGRQETFVSSHRKLSLVVADIKVQQDTLGVTPKYLIQLVAFGLMISLVLYVLYTRDGELGSALPLLAVYAFAAFKLLPAFQQMYLFTTKIQGALPAFRAIEGDLLASLSDPGFGARSSGKVGSRGTPIPLKVGVRFENVCFRYPGKQDLAVDRLDLTIPARKVVGLVGPSGAGKSTLIDLLLALVEPESGRIYIDEKELTQNNKRGWQDSLGFVPQRIFLSNASIRENIAFGLPTEQIDEERVQAAIRMAHLDELILSLPEGANTRVGERGVQLSGGQAQRIGIARALYHGTDVLILDEATAALDGITERLVMDAIHDFSGSKTILIIAHRLTTVKQCDFICVMQNGRIVDNGTFDELLERNELFRGMANSSS